MTITNIEIKARASEEQQNTIKWILEQKKAKYIGTDNQTDTYFKVETGRFKLRKGNLENYFIYYEREDKKEAKQSNVILFENQGRAGELEKIIKKTHEILIEVGKKREIYFIENVKIHIDYVKSLGRFIEIEATSQDDFIPIEKLREQCNYYKELFGIENKNLIKNSYSDMLMKAKNEQI